MHLRSLTPVIRLIYLVLMLMLVTACVTTPTPDLTPTPEPEVDAFTMNQRLARTVNLGNALEAPNEGEWGVVLKEEFFQVIHQKGFTAVRLPVRWEEDWLVVGPATGRVESTYPVPDLPEQTWPDLPTRADFDNSTLAFHWNFLRTPREEFYSISERPGHLRVRLERLSEQTNPSFVGRRQQPVHFRAEVALAFIPQNEHEGPGLALIQNNNFHLLFVAAQQTQPVIRLIRRAHGVEQLLAEQTVTPGQIYLKVEAMNRRTIFIFLINRTNGAQLPKMWMDEF